MKTISYITRNNFKNSIPGDRNTYEYMIKFEKETSELAKFDKIINAIWNIDKNSETSILDGLFHASFDIGDRWFVIEQNPNNTFTFQENKENDIVYILDGCKYQKTLAKWISRLNY